MAELAEQAVAATLQLVDGLCEPVRCGLVAGRLRLSQTYSCPIEGAAGGQPCRVGVIEVPAALRPPVGEI
ncbi:hypothetical protein Pd630_LPD10049 (plasmid) [Rhodococcus opacus PD630]|nr:hypothetical protein Pd630_LPD10049 [Rhodococcus opacus PD630]